MGKLRRGGRRGAGLACFCLLLAHGVSADGVPGGSISNGAESEWPETVTQHFDIHHEDAFTPPGFAIFLEKLHSRLRMDLSQFSPWMAHERVQFYLYSSNESYARGELKPPSWSDGIADYGRKLVAAFDQPNRKKLYEISAHETTHLLFESYWGEVRKKPPHWLNEGLAMLEETDPSREAETSDWYRAMSYLPSKRLIGFEPLTRLSPTADMRNKDQIVIWYVESYAAVYFLYHRHSRLQFIEFCKKLRDGAPLPQALWDVYRYRDLHAFETAWTRWLVETFPTVASSSAHPSGGNLAAQGEVSSDKGGRSDSRGWRLKAMEPADFSFRGLRDTTNSSGAP